MPLVSVIMSTYNRETMLQEAVTSVLNQTFSDIEFIIINDCSTDNTEQIIKNYADSRIRLFNNRVNCGCTFNYHNANNLAKGKYIAHIDDDDIFLPNKLKKQVEFLEQNPQIDMVGTYIETFGDGARPSWVFYSEPEYIDFLMNIYNPICHSSVMYRKSFIDRHALNYDISKKCAQDYDFYKQFVLNVGKITNIPEVLVKYRMHASRLTDIKGTQDIQIYNAEKVKDELLSRYLDKESISSFKDLIQGFPFNNYNDENVEKAIVILSKASKCDLKIAEKIIKDIKNNKFRF